MELQCSRIYVYAGAHGLLEKQVRERSMKESKWGMWLGLETQGGRALLHCSEVTAFKQSCKLAALGRTMLGQKPAETAAFFLGVLA